jgi:16S rRNA processing protein RimM
MVTTTAGPGDRRKKRNKYAAFSKVEGRTLDPLQELEQRAADFNAQRSAPTPPPPAVAADPNVKRGAAQAILPTNLEDLDPYDPTTFGFLEIGRIERPHGIRGEVKVRATTDFGPQRLCTPGLTNIRPPTRRFPRPRVLEAGRKQEGDVYIVKLAGVDSVEKAERLRGHVLYASLAQDSRPPLKQDEWLVTDVVGLTVLIHATGRAIGSVRSVVLGDDLCAIPGLMQDLLEVQLLDASLGPDQYRVTLVPFVPEFVPVVDLATRTIRLTPPDGLLQLTSVRTREVIIRGLLPP